MPYRCYPDCPLSALYTTCTCPYLVSDYISPLSQSHFKGCKCLMSEGSNWLDMGQQLRLWELWRDVSIRLLSADLGCWKQYWHRPNFDEGLLPQVWPQTKISATLADSLKRLQWREFTELCIWMQDMLKTASCIWRCLRRCIDNKIF